MNRDEKSKHICNLLIRDRYPEDKIEKLSEVLIDCFDKHEGFLKAQTVYDAQLCPEFKFKIWRHVLIRMGYIEYPAHILEPWRHFPGGKIRILFPYFTRTEEKLDDPAIRKLADQIETLKKEMFVLQQWKKDQENKYYIGYTKPVKKKVKK